MTWGGPQSLGGVLNTAFSPSAVSWGPGRVDVFAVGLDLQLLHWWHNTRYGRHHPPQLPWSGPEALGGTMASNPTAVSWGPGRLDIFWIDAGTGQLATNSWEEGWTGPRLLGGSLLPQFYTSLTTAQSPPLTPTPASVSGVSLGPGLLDVFASYSDDTVAHWSLSNGWQENLPNTLALPREVTSAPSVVSWGPNRMDVFVNAQGGLAWWWWDNPGTGGGGWSGPRAIPGFSNYNCQGPPNAVSWGLGHLDVFCQGWPEGVSASQLMHFWYDNGWNGPVPRGGTMVSAPGAVSWGAGRLDVFSALATPGGFLEHWWWDNGPAGSAGGWGGPEDIYGFFTGQPCAVSSAPGTLDVFGIDADSFQLNHWSWI
jgi:hypothetical protein